MSENRGFAFWILIVFGIFLIVIYLLGQTMALLNYDFTIKIGLQEPGSIITPLGVAFNKGFGFGDTLVYIPLFILAIAGLIGRKEYGLYTMFGALAITMYWPAVSLSTLYFAKGSSGFHFTAYTSYTIVLSLIFLYGFWGCCYVFRNRKILLTDNQV